MLLAGCAEGSSTAAHARCEQVEEAAHTQVAAAQAALDRATEAAGDAQRAEAAYSSALRVAGFPGTPELNAAAHGAHLARNNAQQAAAEAEREADHQRRLVMQIVVGDPECFDPAGVAKAREQLDAR